jgi:hypothetical protein
MTLPARYRCCGEHCAFCYANRTGRGAYVGHRGYPGKPRKVKRWKMPLSRPSGYGQLESHVGLPAPYGAWEKAWPSLAMFLCDLSWGDGTARVPGKLTLWTADSLWKACLSAPAENAVAFLSGQDPQSLFQALEKAIAKDSVEWRRSVPLAKRGTRR